MQADGNMAYQLLKSRAEAGSRPGDRADSFKLGLVVEGGGMRGASSAGSLQALHDLGLRYTYLARYSFISLHYAELSLFAPTPGPYHSHTERLCPEKRQQKAIWCRFAPDCQCFSGVLTEKP